MKSVFALALLLSGLPTESQLDAPDDSVEIAGTLTLAPVLAHTSGIPMFEVTFTSDCPAFTAPRILARSGIVLDGREYPRSLFVWGGIVNTIEPGDVYRFRLSLGEYMPGAQRQGYSNRLKRWRWTLPLSPGEHGIAVFVRKSSMTDDEYIMSNEIAFVWDDSEPLLYE